MSKKITLKQMEAELHEWGGVYVDRVMRGNDKANRYEVNDPDGKRVAIGFERREVLEMAYAKMQEMIAAETQAQDPVTEAAPEAPQVEAERDALQLSVHGLQAQLDKAKSDFAAAQAIIVRAGKDFEALRNENAVLQAENARIVSLAMNAISDLENDMKGFALSVLDKIVYPLAKPAPAQEAPKASIAKRVRVNWSRGFSSGSYEVLGYSQAKQVYVLNISSDDSKPMPKTVKMSDCEAIV